MQDYQQNRKTAGSNTFGQSAFGSTTQPATTTNLFGQPTQQQPANSIFGSFGNASANNANPGGAFGGLGQNPAPATGGFGTFNQPSQQPTQQPATGGFGSFGQPQQQQNTGAFGNSGAFGPQNKPLGGFGMCYKRCPYCRLTVLQAALADLEGLVILAPLVSLDRPILRNSRPHLPACLDKVSQLVMLLVGGRLVCIFII